MNRMYWVRHGENIANLTLEFSHRKVDYSLTDKGRLQAQQTAEFFREKGLHEIYSSPLKRARETAEIIARPLGLPVNVIEAFREINVGNLEGQPPTAEIWQFHNQLIESWFHGFPDRCFPDGESLNMLVARAQTGMVELLAGKQDRNILLVAHGGIFACSLPTLVPDLGPLLISQGMGNCAVSELLGKVVDGHFAGQLISYASTAHLSGEAARLVSGIRE